MAQQNYRRRNYLISKQTQGRIIFRFIIPSLIGGIVTVVLFVFLATKKIDSVIYAMRLPNISTGELLWREILTANLIIVVLISIFFAITARIIIKKVTGPLSKISSDLQRAKEGNLTLRIQLRKNDDFHYFANDLNEMLVSLQSMFKEVQNKSSDVIEITQSLKSSDFSQESIKKLNQSIIELEKQSAKFST